MPDKLRRPGESSKAVLQWIEEARGMMPIASPSPAELECMLDTAFFASMLKEEGHSLKFALMYCKDEGKDDVMGFASPIPLGPATLRKLTCGFDSWKSALAVRFDGRQGYIFGVAQQPHDNAFPGQSSHRTQLMVRSHATGAILVEQCGQAIAHFANGRMRRAPGRHETLLMVPRLMGRRLDSPNWRELLRVVERMQRLGHGGTLVALEHEDDPPEISMPNRFDPPSSALAKAYQQGAAASGYEARLQPGDCTNLGVVLLACPVREERAALNAIDDELDFVARLSSLDGAVIVDPQLRVLAFGAFFNSTAEPTSVLRINPDKTTEQISLAKIGGARHQSACRWASQNPEAGYVFVVSQDGTTHFVVGAPDRSVAVMGPLWITPEGKY